MYDQGVCRSGVTFGLRRQSTTRIGIIVSRVLWAVWEDIPVRCVIIGPLIQLRAVKYLPGYACDTY